jgi:hypothetical protein
MRDDIETLAGGCQEAETVANALRERAHLRSGVPPFCIVADFVTCIPLVADRM